jgi:hypothetical protein
MHISNYMTLRPSIQHQTYLTTMQTPTAIVCWIKTRTRIRIVIRFNFNKIILVCKIIIWSKQIIRPKSPLHSVFKNIQTTMRYGTESFRIVVLVTLAKNTSQVHLNSSKSLSPSLRLSPVTPVTPPTMSSTSNSRAALAKSWPPQRDSDVSLRTIYHFQQRASIWQDKLMQNSVLLSLWDLTFLNSECLLVDKYHGSFTQ